VTVTNCLTLAPKGRKSDSLGREPRVVEGRDDKPSMGERDLSPLRGSLLLISETQGLRPGLFLCRPFGA